MTSPGIRQLLGNSLDHGLPSTEREKRRKKLFYGRKAFFFLSTVIAKDNSNVESALVFKAIQLFVPKTLKSQSKR